MGYGALLAWIAAVALGVPLHIALSPAFVPALLYLAVFGSVLAFAAYYTLLARIGPSRAAYVGVSSTVVALFVSTLFEGYAWHGEAVLGLALAGGQRAGAAAGAATVRRILGMKIDGRAWRSLWEVDDRPGHAPRLAIIDQTRLPYALVTHELGDCAAVIDAIRGMQLRGAPLIGVAGAYGLALALRADASDAALAQAHAALLAARPTAVNLRWALARVHVVVAPLAPAARAAAAWREAEAIADEDVALNRAHRRARRRADRRRARAAPAGPCRCSRTATPAGSRPSTGAPRWRRSTRRTTPASRCTSGSTRRGRATRAC